MRSGQQQKRDDKREARKAVREKETDDGEGEKRDRARTPEGKPGTYPTSQARTEKKAAGVARRERASGAPRRAAGTREHDTDAAENKLTKEEEQEPLDEGVRKGGQHHARDERAV